MHVKIFLFLLALSHVIQQKCEGETESNSGLLLQREGKQVGKGREGKGREGKAEDEK
jgi:hypothetical protein